MTEKAKEFVIESGYDPIYGARPLKRFLQQQVETLIAKAIIAGDLAVGSEMRVDYDGEKLVIV